MKTAFRRASAAVSAFVLSACMLQGGDPLVSPGGAEGRGEPRARAGHGCDTGAEPFLLLTRPVWFTPRSDPKEDPCARA